MNYINRFSATEKVIFGLLVVIATVTALAMADGINSFFMIEIPSNNGKLTEGLVGLPHTINPILAVTDVDRDISALVYSGLTTYKDGAFIPDLAASSTISSDGLTYSFTLKSGLHFQDGTPLTTDDVAYTIQKIQDAALKSPLRADWKDVTVKVISPTVIQLTLKQPYSPFISNTTVGIIPKHIWSALNDDQFVLSQYNIEPIGSGPYKESSIGKTNGIPDSYSLSAWSDYYDQHPYISSMTFKFYADQEKALSALDSGSIDSLPSISAVDAARLAARLSSNTAASYRTIAAPLPRVFGVFFNQNQSPVLADKNVRMALNMVVDRNAIIKSALNGYGKAVSGPLPFSVSGVATPDLNAGLDLSLKTTSSTSAATSLLAAQNLLEKNGWVKDPTTKIYGLSKKGVKTIQTLSFDIYTANTPDLKQAAEMVRKSWTDLGALVTVKVFEPSDLYQNIISTRKYDALLFGEFIGSDRDLFAFWHSSERNSPGLNVALYTNSKVDKLLESIRNTTNDSTRQSQYLQFSQLIAADLPAIFLYMPDFIYAVPKSLHGIDLGTIALPSDRFNSIADWYDTTERVWKIFAHNQ